MNVIQVLDPNLGLGIVQHGHHLLPVVLEEVPQLQDFPVNLLGEGGGRGRGVGGGGLWWRAHHHAARGGQQLLELFLY